jgi:hypothetical protein
MFSDVAIVSGVYLAALILTYLATEHSGEQAGPAGRPKPPHGPAAEKIAVP